MIIKTECSFPKQNEIVVASEDDDSVLTLSVRCPFCNSFEWVQLTKGISFACSGCGFQAKFRSPGNVLRLVDNRR